MDENLTSHNNEAYNAYKVLEKRGELDVQEVLRTLDSFATYLKNICHSLGTRTPKQNFIYHRIFDNKWEDKDMDKYCKANIFAATESLGRVISKCKKHEITPVFRTLLIDYICDLKVFINYYDKSQNYKWLAMNTNGHVSNFYYDLAINAFYNGMPGNHVQEHLVLSSSTPFIIRQSIEYKIKRILGIKYIKYLGKPHKTFANVYFKALRNNKSFYRTREFDFEVIEKIHSWTHLYIHGGVRSRPWLTEIALHCLKELFYSGKTSDSQTVSLYAGIEILDADLGNLREKTKESINNELGQNAEIVWLIKPELVYIKANQND